MSRSSRPRSEPIRRSPTTSPPPRSPEHVHQPIVIPNLRHVIRHALPNVVEGKIIPVVLFFGLYRGGNRYDVHFELLAEQVEAGPRARRARARVPAGSHSGPDDARARPRSFERHLRGHHLGRAEPGRGRVSTTIGSRKRATASAPSPASARAHRIASAAPRRKE